MRIAGMGRFACFLILCVLFFVAQAAQVKDGVANKHIVIRRSKSLAVEVLSSGAAQAPGTCLSAQPAGPGPCAKGCWKVGKRRQGVDTCTIDWKGGKGTKCGWTWKGSTICTGCPACLVTPLSSSSPSDQNTPATFQEHCDQLQCAGKCLGGWWDSPQYRQLACVDETEQMFCEEDYRGDVCLAAAPTQSPPTPSPPPPPIVLPSSGEPYVRAELRQSGESINITFFCQPGKPPAKPKVWRLAAWSFRLFYNSDDFEFVRGLSNLYSPTRGVWTGPPITYDNNWPDPGHGAHPSTPGEYRVLASGGSQDGNAQGEITLESVIFKVKQYDPWAYSTRKVLVSGGQVGQLVNQGSFGYHEKEPILFAHCRDRAQCPLRYDIDAALR